MTLRDFLIVNYIFLSDTYRHAVSPLPDRNCHCTCTILPFGNDFPSGVSLHLLISDFCNDYFLVTLPSSHYTSWVSGFRNDSHFKNVIATKLVSRSAMKLSLKTSLHPPLFPDLQ